MSGKRYTEEFKVEAVKQIADGGDSSSSWGTQNGDGRTRHSTRVRSALFQGVRVKYAFIQSQKQIFPTKSVFRVIGVYSSGFYAWRRQSGSVAKFGLFYQRPHRNLRGIKRTILLEPSC